MVGPNPSAPLRVLVYDPAHVSDTEQAILPRLCGLLHQRFGEGQPFPGIPGRDHRTSPVYEFTASNIAYTVVTEMDALGAMFHTNQNPAAPPYYSLVAYDGTRLKQERHPAIISQLRRGDYFIPQLVIGGSGGLIGNLQRAGVQFYGRQDDEVEKQLNMIFGRTPTLSNLSVVKIGGSTYDFLDDTGRGENIEQVCRTLVSLWDPPTPAEPPKRPRILRRMAEQDARAHPRKRHQILLTAGAGRHGDATKRFTAAFRGNRRVQERFPHAMADSLEMNLLDLETLFPHADTARGQAVGKFIDTSQFYYIGKGITRQHIPLIGTAPHYIMARDGIPLQDSDTHTVALAEFFGAKRVVLVKRTDGIYDHDPLRGFVLDPTTGNCADPGQWERAQAKNRQHGTLSVQQFLSTIATEGTGRDGNKDGSTGHLMERSALEYFAQCRHVEEILVTHIAPLEFYRPAGNDRLAHIVTNEELTLSGPAHDPAERLRDLELRMLDRTIREAITEGIARSKIIRG